MGAGERGAFFFGYISFGQAKESNRHAGAQPAKKQFARSATQDKDLYDSH
jgi:hypothetical protein